MKRILIFCAVLALILSGCGKDTGKSIDFQSFCADLLTGGAFTEELIPVDTELGCAHYGIDQADCKQAMFYLSSGATAEELALFEARDAEALGRIKDAVNNRLRLQTDSFESYLPSEVPKLEKAIVFTRGNYVILIVADDYDSASNVLHEY
ncbi:MAG: DUF4358 domain-containing protein [Clostridiales bacterium]|jgi:hypothetical protein|nr:DUF4358 domain-containing protein [Clostridiales bacterium]